MECNRDEAVRARDIAERKYGMHDYAGAKKFILKAQHLFPSLEGLAQMLPVVDVQIVAQVKVAGNETDWYGILQVEPGADDAIIKKQYRKLALLLHPDKNKAKGAEAAFKLISEAWGVLSDKNKRAVHDMRRGVKLKVQVSQARVGADLNSQFAATHQTPPNSSPAVPSNIFIPPTSSSVHTRTAHPSGTTFWTSCPRCRMQYQYMRTYENYQLQCHKCKEVFRATDMHATRATTNGAYGWGQFTDPQRQEFNPPKASNGEGNGFVNGGSGPFATTGSKLGNFFTAAASAAAAQSKVAQAAAAASNAVPDGTPTSDVVQQTYHKVKRERQEAEKEAKRKEKELKRKEREDQRREKEEQRKAREHERAREAMERLVAKRKEKEDSEKTNSKRREGRPKRLKRKRPENETGEEEEIEVDAKLFENITAEDQAAGSVRRSSRAKRNVACYKVDSEDSDLEDFPRSKRSKADGDCGVKLDPDVESLKDADTVKNQKDEMQKTRPENGKRSDKGKSLASDEKETKLGSSKDTGEGSRTCDGLGTKKTFKTETMEKVDDSQCDSWKQDLSDVPARRVQPSRDVTSSKSGRKTEVAKPTRNSELAKEAMKSESPTNQQWRIGSGLANVDEEKASNKSLKTQKSKVKSPESNLKSPESKANSFSSKGRGASEEKVQVEDKHEVRSSSPDNSLLSASDPEGEDIIVPDPDFHDFDSCRTEKDVCLGQIWALYDDQDGMPRFYGKVLKVSIPFKVQISWLEPYGTSKELVSWMSATGLSITCGEFKPGKLTTIEQINIFSHIIMEKAPSRHVKIFPQKGQVWAVYRDWGNIPTIDSTSEGNDPKLKYDMVEILSDFSETTGGVAIGKLSKVSGFKTLFRLVFDDGPLVYNDLQKFSHSVPAHRLDGMEAPNVPTGCWELDPASTPLDLIYETPDLSR